MPICRKCNEEKDMFSFPYIDSKRCYDNICKKCRRDQRKNCECERLRNGWDALQSEGFIRQKKRSRKHEIR